MQERLAVKQRGFWFRAHATIGSHKRGAIWTINIDDHPSDPDWAAWCTLIDMGSIQLPEDLDTMTSHDGNILQISGLVI